MNLSVVSVPFLSFLHCICLNINVGSPKTKRQKKNNHADEIINIERQTAADELGMELMIHRTCAIR